MIRLSLNNIIHHLNFSIMSVLSHHRCREVFDSRPFEDLSLVFKKDKSGADVPTFIVTDNKSIIESNGSAFLWSLEKLLEAGINPAIPISTSANTRLSADEALSNAIDEGLAIINESNKNE